MTSVVLSSDAGHHVVNELPLEPIMFGVITLATFLVLLGVLWSFRNTLLLDPVEHHHHDAATGGSGASHH